MRGGRTHRTCKQSCLRSNSRDFPLSARPRLVWGCRRASPGPTGCPPSLRAVSPSRKGESTLTGEAEEAAIAFLERLDPASQLEVLRRFEEVMDHEADGHSRRLRRA